MNYECIRIPERLIIYYYFISGDELRRSRSSKRDDPRRHTLSGDQHHNYQPALTRSMDLEVSYDEQLTIFTL